MAAKISSTVGAPAGCGEFMLEKPAPTLALADDSTSNDVAIGLIIPLTVLVPAPRVQTAVIGECHNVRSTARHLDEGGSSDGTEQPHCAVRIRWRFVEQMEAFFGRALEPQGHDARDAGDEQLFLFGCLPGLPRKFCGVR